MFQKRSFRLLYTFVLLSCIVLLVAIPSLREEFLRQIGEVLRDAPIKLDLGANLSSILGFMGSVLGFLILLYESIFFFWHIIFGTTDPPAIGTILSLITAGLAVYFLGGQSLLLALAFVSIHALWMLSLFVKQWRIHNNLLLLSKALQQALKGQNLLRIQQIGMAKDKSSGAIYARIGVAAESSEFLNQYSCPSFTNTETNWRILRFRSDWAYLVLEMPEQKAALALYIGKPQQLIRIHGIHTVYADERPIPGLGRRSNLARFLKLLDTQRELCIFPLKGREGAGLRLQLAALPTEWRGEFSEEELAKDYKTAWSVTYHDPTDLDPASLSVTTLG